MTAITDHASKVDRKRAAVALAALALLHLARCADTGPADGSATGEAGMRDTATRDGTKDPTVGDAGAVSLDAVPWNATTPDVLMADATAGNDAPIDATNRHARVDASNLDAASADASARPQTGAKTPLPETLFPQTRRDLIRTSPTAPHPTLPTCPTELLWSVSLA